MALLNLKNRTFKKDDKIYRVKSHFADQLNCVELKPNTMRAKMNASIVKFNLADVQQNLIDQLNIELTAGGKKIATMVKEIVSDMKPKDKYYRLFDTEAGRYMSTGFNAHGIADLAEQYESYISVDYEFDGVELKDVDKDDVHVWHAEKNRTKILLDGKDEKEIKAIIQSNGFQIEDNDTPFCIECESTNTEAYNDLESGKWLCRCKDCNAEGVV